MGLLKKSKKDILKIILFLMLGGAGGYLYYFYIGCRSGVCPLQSNPVISILIGLTIGYLFIPDSIIKNLFNIMRNKDE